METTKIHIVFYSTYGHVYRMAEAITEGARQVTDADVTLWQVPELMDEAALIKSGAKMARAAFAHIPTCLLYTSPSPRDRTRSRMPSSA